MAGPPPGGGAAGDAAQDPLPGGAVLDAGELKQFPGSQQLGLAGEGSFWRLCEEKMKGRTYVEAYFVLTQT